MIEPKVKEYIARSPLNVTISVWKALFLREVISRLSANRTAWLWIFLDPMIQIVMMVIIFTTIRMRVVGGINTPIWLMTGLIAFNMFRSTGKQLQNSVNSNKALFTYRQVKPIDTVISRALLEGVIGMMVAIILFCGSFLFDFGMFPDDPLKVLIVFFGMWLMGVGFGLITSVLSTLIPVAGKFIAILMMPLYFCSGVILPITIIPAQYRQWLAYNPLLHGVDAIRVGFAPYYHAIPELNIGYLYGFALCMIFFGLVLYRRYSSRMIQA